MSGIVVGYKTELGSALEGTDMHRVFQLGREIVYPSTDGAFIPSETVYALIQTWNAPPEYRLRMALSSEKEKGSPREKNVGSYGGGAAVEAFPLAGLESGPYRIEAELLDANGNVVAQRAAELSISPRTSIPRAGFVFRHSFNTDAPGLLALALGQQYMARGELAEAETAFTRAVAAKNPDLVVANWKLATVLLYSRKADAALELLLPLADAYGSEPEVVEGLGLAHYMKSQYSEAVRLLEHAITLRPPEPQLLNALGDSYQSLGQHDKARETFERSLALNPGQEAVKARLDTLAKSNSALDRDAGPLGGPAPRSSSGRFTATARARGDRRGGAPLRADSGTSKDARASGGHSRPRADGALLAQRSTGSRSEGARFEPASRRTRFQPIRALLEAGRSGAEARA